MRASLAVLLCLAVCYVATSQDAKKSDLKTAEKVTLPDKDKVAKLITDFMLTEFADREKFVIDPDDYKKGHEAYYKRGAKPDQVEVTGMVLKAIDGKKGAFTATTTASGLVGKRPITQKQTHIVTDTKDGLRIDWGATAGYNPVTCVAWEAGTDLETTARVKAKLSTFYVGRFDRSKATFLSVEIREQFGDYSYRTHGYIEKASEEGQRLHALLKDGQEHNVILTLGKCLNVDGAVFIEKVKSESWVK